MNSLHFLWIALCIGLPLCGAAWVASLPGPAQARKACTICLGLSLIAATGAWLDFQWFQLDQAGDSWKFAAVGLDGQWFALDRISAPLLPLVSLVFFLTCVATVRAKMPRFSYGRCLLLQSMVLAFLACASPGILVALLSLETVLPAIELWKRGGSMRAFCLYTMLFIGLAVYGQYAVDRAADPAERSWAVVALSMAMLIRAGIAPFHSWIPDLVDRASFGGAMLFVTPMLGVYGVVRLVVPIAANDLLVCIEALSIGTALYGAAMALVQNDGRHFYSYLTIGQGAVVTAGVLTLAPVAMTGALCTALSSTISLCGLGLTLRALEARRGSLNLSEFQGLYEKTPYLAMCYLLTALAAVGFPGTSGFIGLELLIDGAVNAHPSVGIALVISTALNGIAAMRVYFLLFGGPAHTFGTSLDVRRRERLAVLAVAILIILGGFFPHPYVASLEQAAEDLIEQRTANARVAPLVSMQ